MLLLWGAPLHLRRPISGRIATDFSTRKTVDQKSALHAAARLAPPDHSKRDVVSGSPPLWRLSNTFGHDVEFGGMMITKDFLIAFGQALYGVSFSANMAHDIRYPPQEIHGWLSGEHAVPDDVWIELDRIAEFRIFQLKGLRELLADESPSVKRDRSERKGPPVH